MNPAQDATGPVRDFTDGRGADGVFVTASSQAAGELALRTAARRARIVLYASIHPPAKLDLDWNRVHYDEIMLTGSEGKTPEDLYQAANLLSSRAIDVQPLVSRVIRLEELPEELSKVPTGETQRVVVRVH